MVSKAKLSALGPSKLSQALAQLNAQPKLTLNALKSLRISYAFRNDHFGARHFAKDYLPRIRYANPALNIQVEKVLKTPQEAWRPAMEVEFTNGTVHTVDMQQKWSTAILKELMDLAGDDSWGHWKSHARASGQPIVPGEENEASVVASADGAVLPTLKAFRAAQISGSAQPEPSGRKTKSSPARAAPPSKSTVPEAS
ncbi:hypothetical protein AX14_000883 [Amanita brunnescens Koide BX004]|nr:hypothetical protein AX14_000883 [Amanita brunnescens Koide BX004]